MEKEKSLYDVLLETLGEFSMENVESIDEDGLFTKGGVTVISALAGEGKTTLIQNMSKKWEDDGYNFIHINFDTAPTYGKKMLNPPKNRKEISEFLKSIQKLGSDKDIIVIDSLKAFTSFVECDIENNQDMYKIMQDLREISIHTGVSFILIHHVYKPKNVKTMPSSFYGSRAVEEQCDSGWILEKGEARIVKSRHGHVRDSIVQFDEMDKLLN